MAKKYGAVAIPVPMGSCRSPPTPMPRAARSKFDEGTEVLADPGTYCYHGEPGWRSYFRSTLAHNTIEVNGQDQSSSGGPFLWTRHAGASSSGSRPPRMGDHRLVGEHDGYRALDSAPDSSSVSAIDMRSGVWTSSIDLETTGDTPSELAFHLGPISRREWSQRTVELTWSTGLQRRRDALPARRSLVVALER